MEDHTVNGKPWENEDEEKLVQIFPHASDTELLEEFYPRSLMAILTKARKLGVTRGYGRVLNRIHRNQLKLKGEVI